MRRATDTRIEVTISRAEYRDLTRLAVVKRRSIAQLFRQAMNEYARAHAYDVRALEPRVQGRLH